MPQLPAKILLLSALLCACASGPNIDPNHPASLEKASAAELLTVGRDAAQRGDSVRAEQYLAMAMEEGADARVVMPILLKACIRSSHLRTALNHAEPHLLANPEDDELRKLVANIHLGLGQTADARRELGLLLQRSESNPDAHYLLGVIATREDIGAARAHFLKAIEYTDSEERRTEVRSRLSELELREREARLSSTSAPANSGDSP